MPPSFVYCMGKLQIHTQELLGQDTHDEGYHSNGDADDGHFQETGLEGLVLGNGGVVSKTCDDQDHHCKHAEQGRHIHSCRQQQIGSDQGDDGEQIGNAGIGAGLQGIAAAFTPGSQEFRGCHGEGGGNTHDQAGQGNEPVVLQSESKTCQRAGQLHQSII